MLLHAPLLKPTLSLQPPIAFTIITHHRCSPPTLSVLPASIATDPWTVFAILATAAATGQRAAETPIGKRLSGPICAMAITFGLAAFNVLPASTATVASAQGLAVRLATPLLLYEANLRSIGRRASRMLPAFFAGSVGTSLGALAAVAILGGPLAAVYGDDGYKVAAALAAKNIGGGLNFVAVAAALGLSAGPFATALAMDNIMALVYFPACAWLGRDKADPKAETAKDSNADAEQDDASSAVVSSPEQSAALAIALCAVAASQWLALRFLPGFDLPIATILVVALATAMPRAIGRYSKAGSQLGTTSIFLFFATAGWTGGALGSAALLQGGPLLLGFLGILYAVHLTISLGLGAILRKAFPTAGKRLWNIPTLLVASNANIGGPATASALAVGNGWPSLVTPSLLVGNLGYALATPLAIVLHAAFRALGRGFGFVC